MSTDPLTIENSALLPSGQSFAASKSEAVQPAQNTGKRTLLLGDQVFLSGNLDTKYQEIQLKNERSNAAAGAIRTTDRSLTDLGQKIDTMKAPLEAIVKNFPPFSAQDKARMKLLMAYSTIRKEIDQLTFPSPPDVVKARNARDVLTLPTPLPLDANDGQIADHLTNLDATGASLNRMRAGLAAETAALLRDGRFSRIFSLPDGAETTRTGVPQTESAAAQKSAQVGQQFANLVGQGVTDGSSQFLKGLG